MVSFYIVLGNMNTCEVTNGWQLSQAGKAGRYRHPGNSPRLFFSHGSNPVMVLIDSAYMTARKEKGATGQCL
jgi:hypothetical protein